MMETVLGRIPESMAASASENARNHFMHRQASSFPYVDKYQLVRGDFVLLQFTGPDSILWGAPRSLAYACFWDGCSTFCTLMLTLTGHCKYTRVVRHANLLEDCWPDN